MESLLSFNVIPQLPHALEFLRELAYNMWWSWEPSARWLFRELDSQLWNKVHHNPVRMLQLCRQERLVALSRDDHYLEKLHQVETTFHRYLERIDTYAAQRVGAPNASIAYFSAEYGLHESFPNYSGGLGILSGDHCKSASDLGLNFVGVGLLYRDGYFRQKINADGWQEAEELNQKFGHLPISKVKKDGKTLHVSIDLPGRSVVARVWKVLVGRITLYLLDTTLPENSHADQMISRSLYGGNHDLRVEQELILGVGGFRLLEALEIRPHVFHMNEGHSAFLGLERIRHLIEKSRGGPGEKLNFDTALQVVAASTVFTTHTPVPAGNDLFSQDLIGRYFQHYPEQVGISWEHFWSLGRVDQTPTFNMTILALKTSRFANGVSRLHGEVSRRLWQPVWKGVPVDEIPITSITNGVHAKTWAAGEFHELYTQYLGSDWQDHQNDPNFWFRVANIPDHKLWNLHQLLKRRTIDFLRSRLRQQRLRNGESAENLRQVDQLLHPDVLTIGFARRFATYKRGGLLFSEPERLRQLVTNKERPLQLIFAGKAHPADNQGKEIIQQVYRYSRDPTFEGRIILVEDYDINIGRRLYQACDLWLNTPLRPYEASGTSGMKLPLNGGLNLSVLDGWWLEGYNGKNGWAIGGEDIQYDDPHQNESDTASLFHLLETQIAPLYYVRPDQELPLAWIQLMRESMRTLIPHFTTDRMVQEYDQRLYQPAARAYQAMKKNDYEAASALSHWKERLRQHWQSVTIPSYRVLSSTSQIANEQSSPDAFFVGKEVPIEAEVILGQIAPEDIQVQAYLGPLEKNQITDPLIINLSLRQKDADGLYHYEGHFPAKQSGHYGVNVRVIPKHELLLQDHEMGLITWAYCQ